MEDENLQAQNPGEGTPEPAQPQGGEEKTEQLEVDTPEADKNDKKDRDFEKGMYKWREKAKELQAELDAVKTPSSIPAPAGESGEEDQQQAIEQAKNLLRDVVKEELAPVRSELEASKRESAIEKIGKMPYTADYADDIVDEAKNLPQDWSLEKRLELARASVISRNLDTIVQNNREAGKDEAYENQSGKKQPIMGAAPSKAGGEGEKTLLERYNNRELSTQEITENWDEIDKQRKAELGI